MFRSLSEMAFVFLKLGTIGFGGPAAHIAMMEDEIVRKRQWISRQEFLDLLGATHFIPGPNSTELAIHIGHARGGWKGLIVAGSCFIFPAALIVTAIAWVYVKYGSLPTVQPVLYGIKPVIIAIVFQAIWGLTKTAIKTRFLGALLGLAVGVSFLGVNELVVIFICGFISFLYLGVKNKSLWLFAPMSASTKSTGLLVLGAASLNVFVPVSSEKIFLFFLKVGSVLFGSGYVLIAFLRTDLVEKWHWLTEAQLLDAIAVGQFTPGPVFTTATFIGFLLAGFKGATLATLGIFLPAFFFVALTAPIIKKLRKSPSAAAILDGVNVASLAIMSVTCLLLAKSAIFDLPSLGIFIASGFCLLRCKVNSALLVLAGAVLGILL